jgi:adenylate cyclase
MMASHRFAYTGVFGLRRLRLVTGLTLFTYVGLHLTDHALGNLSVAAMEDGLVLQKLLWQGLSGTLMLYTALVTHFSLGLWALYQRRHYGWTLGEGVQLILGLSIPALLINHLIVTRLALALYGLEKGYAQELYSFHVQSPLLGWVQLCVLIVAWSHGCLGVYYWLRLRPFFRSLAPGLSAAAVLLPVLALLGYLQGGRQIVAIAQDPAWRAANLSANQVGTPPQAASLLGFRNSFLWAYGAALLAILAARGLRLMHEYRARSIRIAYPHGRSLRVPVGFSVLDASLKGRVPHAHVCGGRGRCSTCRIRVVGGDAGLPAPGPVEAAVLARIGAAPGTRLACQLRPGCDLGVVPLLPPQVAAAVPRPAAGPAARQGEERFVVVLVADMRESTRLGTERLPFDAVFIVARFLDAVGSAVAAAGGRPAQFTGDGMLALFGIDTGPEQACAQAIRAVAAIGAAVSDLNRLLAADLARPIGFGLGIHGGTAVIGEIGYAAARIFTALGEPPNLASRLEGLCKDLGAEAVVSETVCALSGFDLAHLPQHQAALRGHDGAVMVRVVASAVDFVPA